MDSEDQSQDPGGAGTKRTLLTISEIEDKFKIALTQEEMDTLCEEVFANNNFLKVSKRLLAQYSVLDGIYISYLLEQYFWWKENGKVGKDGWFYLTRPHVKSITTIGETAQDRITRDLIREGILECQTRRVGRKKERHYHRPNTRTLTKGYLKWDIHEPSIGDLRREYHETKDFDPLCKKIFREQEFVKVSKRAIKPLGAMAGLFLSYLLDQYFGLKEKGKIDEDRWFYLDAEKVQQNIQISEPTQITVAKELTRLGIVETKVQFVTKESDGSREESKCFKVSTQRLIELYIQWFRESPDELKLWRHEGWMSYEEQEWEERQKEMEESQEGGGVAGLIRKRLNTSSDNEPEDQNQDSDESKLKNLESKLKYLSSVMLKQGDMDERLKQRSERLKQYSEMLKQCGGSKLLKQASEMLKQYSEMLKQGDRSEMLKQVSEMLKQVSEILEQGGGSEMLKQASEMLKQVNKMLKQGDRSEMLKQGTKMLKQVRKILEQDSKLLKQVSEKQGGDGSELKNQDSKPLDQDAKNQDSELKNQGSELKNQGSELKNPPPNKTYNKTYRNKTYYKVSKDTIRDSANPLSSCTISSQDEKPGPDKEGTETEEGTRINQSKESIHLKRTRPTTTQQEDKSLQDRVREKVGPKEEPKPVPILDPLVQYMNYRLPGHKMKGYRPDGKPHKNYTNLLRYIKQLHTGMQGQLWGLSKGYLQRVNIPLWVLEHKFTDRELKQTISRMSKLWEESNYPKNKHWLSCLSRDLLIYNPGNKSSPTPFSLFLEVFANGVKQRSEVLVREMWSISPYKKQGEEICELFNVHKEDWDKKDKILKYMNKIAEFRQSLPKNYGRVEYFTSYEPVWFIQDYISRWLIQDQALWYRERGEVSCINPKSKLFREYLDFDWDAWQVGASLGLSYFLDKFLFGRSYAKKKLDEECEKEREYESGEGARKRMFGENCTDESIREELDFIKTLSDEEFDKLYPPEGSIQEEEPSPSSSTPHCWVDPFSAESLKLVFDDEEGDDTFDDGEPL